MEIRNLLNKGLKYLFSADYRFDINSSFGIYDRLSDEEFLKRKYHALIGRNLNLNAPQSFTEKIQWMKLYNRKQEYSVMVDKYRVRQYIKEKLGDEYLIPFLGVWEKTEDIDFNLLPNQFVIKCNHNSGTGMCICRDKSKIEVEIIRNKLNKGLRENYYLTNREWPYKNVPRMIIAEALITTNNGDDLRDYKFFCFGGEVKFFKIDFDRFTNHKANYYDRNCKILPFYEKDYPADFDRVVSFPENIEEMILLAEKLSCDIPFVRVDFYNVDGKIYFGEITFFPASGVGKFEPEEWDFKIGKWIALPEGGASCEL